MLTSLQRIKSWFYDKVGRVANKATQSTKVLDLDKKSVRRLSVAQAFSRLYYAREYRPRVQLAYAEYLGKVAEGKTPMSELNFRMAAMAKAYDDASQEVKDEVAEFIEKVKKGLVDYNPDDDADGDDEVSAEEAARRTTMLTYQK